MVRFGFRALPLVDNATIEFDPEGRLRVKDDGIVPSKLAFGTWEKLAEVVLTTAVTHVDFTGLNIARDKIYVLYCVFKNPTGSHSKMRIFVNGDYSEANYYVQQGYFSGASISGYRGNESQIIWVPNGERAFCEVTMTLDPDGYFRWHSLSARYTGASLEGFVHTGCRVISATNVTSIRISATISGSIGAGSLFMLYRPRTR